MQGAVANHFGDLEMFNELSSIYRLSLCLLLSAGVHGGLVFYDWVTTPAKSSLVHAPVAVSFLPAVDARPSSLTPEPEVSETKARAPEAEQPVPVSPPVPLVPEKTATKVLPAKPSVVAATEELKLVEPPVDADEACKTPQEVVNDEPAELFTESQSGAGHDVKEVPQEGTPGSTQKATEFTAENNVLGSDSVQALVEAVPQYRSNPLPKYPYLARQRHWEGVVWLLIDISAEGLVDDLRVEQSCGHRILDRSAARTVRRWQFSPAKRAGLPVSSQVRLPIRFRLEDS